MRQARTVFALTAPAYLWLAVTVLLPLAAMFYFSFLTASPLGGKEVHFTLKNYTDFFTKHIYWYNAWRSIELGLYVTALCLVIGYPAALGLAKYVKGRWREAIFLLIILPFWSNALVRTFSWTMVLREPFNILFSYPAIVVGLVHAYLPYAILTCYISLQAIDDALIEAGRSLGATPAQAFRRITLPLSMPGILAAIFLIFVPVIGSFMEPRILGGKDAIMLGPIIEGQFITAFNWPLGAALSFTMLGMVLVILLAATPFLKKQMAVG
ncbi:ABC transporter permease [Taklimakanibacter deserti]|uniref:ABC transporter permease n=1 Tax=Taklimakanibacter deserti TaxID=2267839 RepID=UPI000E658D79